MGSVWSDWSLGFGDNMGNRQGYNGRHDRPVPTLVGAGMLGGPAVVMAACGRARTLVVTHIGALGLSRYKAKLGEIVQCVSI